MNEISENIKRLKDEIALAAVRAGRNPSDVRLMAVTKTQTVMAVNEAISAGVNLLGENKAQELCDRYDGYNKNGVDIHFIGHLQTNKVKYIAGKVSMIESVDSLRLASEISRQSEKRGVVTDLLVEVNIGREDSKSGILPESAEELIREIAPLPSVRVRGLMAIPPLWNDSAANERFFAAMHEMLVDIRGKNIDNISMEFLSMGMSDDFAAAIKHGSTQVRLGTAIFGSRNYG